MLAGATNVGKTSFSKRYDAGMFDEAFLPTIGIDFVSTHPKKFVYPCRFEIAANY
jgi:GTPase SAR1 family protein